MASNAERIGALEQQLRMLNQKVARIEHALGSRPSPFLLRCPGRSRLQSPLLSRLLGR